MRYLFFVITTIFFLGSIFYGGVFARASDSFVGQVKSVFALPFLLVKGAFLRLDIAREFGALAMENQSLRAELLARKDDFPRRDAPLIAAKVYALYPLNDKSVLTLASGASAGIREGAAVLAAKGILLGQVIRVENDWSEARTVFDLTHDIPVRIGSSATNGLLRGGATPVITLIAKGKPVAVGDPVYATSRDLPYGLVVGSVSEVRENPGAAFVEAPLTLPYSLHDLTTVFVVR
ncbi:MAG: rod shape-determining protein MreC [bacterium]|nr:rod shape-determining protein MreC [bacterium]